MACDRLVRMRLQEIYVYPVKSMAGQRVEHWPLTAAGLAGDRGWAVRDGEGKLGSGKDSRRFRRLDPLFTWRARLVGPEAPPQVTDGDGEEAIWWDWADPAVAQRLSAQCANPVRVGAHVDAEAGLEFKDAGAVSLVGTATLAALGAAVGHLQRGGLGVPIDPRHLRVNLVIDTEEPFVEDGWVGSPVRIGDAQFVVSERVVRCRMVNLAQADLAAEPGLLRATGARDACAAVYLRPTGDARLAYGDVVSLPSQS